MQKTLTVQGAAQISVKPDLLIVSQIVRCSALCCKEAIQATERRVEEMREGLLAIGFGKNALKTTEFYTSPSYENETDESGRFHKKFLGYVSTHALKIEFEPDSQRLEEVLRVITKGETNPEISLQFAVKDKAAARQELLRRAIEDAKKSASALAEGAGIRLGDIISIDYGGASQRFVSTTQCSVNHFARDGALSAQVVPDDIGLSDCVTVTWEIS